MAKTCDCDHNEYCKECAGSKYVPIDISCPSCAAKDARIAVLQEAFDTMQILKEGVSEANEELRARIRELEEIELLYPNWKERFPSLAVAIKCHTDNQDSVIKILRANTDKSREYLEELFPRWKSFRDLEDCIRCELSELRRRAKEG